MALSIPAIFALAYVGTVLGGLPYFQLDRTGVVLLVVIARIGTEG